MQYFLFNKMIPQHIPSLPSDLLQDHAPPNKLIPIENVCPRDHSVLEYHRSNQATVFGMGKIWKGDMYFRNTANTVTHCAHWGTLWHTDNLENHVAVEAAVKLTL
ncbi:uncharacterized protein LOC144748690 isoform X2 [Ciona intestinalis]